MDGRNEKCIDHFGQKPEGKMAPFGDLGIDKRIIFE
jgi:hypothetical protein